MVVGIPGYRYPSASSPFWERLCNLEYVSEAVSDYGLIDSTGIMVVFYLFSNHQKRHQTKQISVLREGEGEIQMYIWNPPPTRPFKPVVQAVAVPSDSKLSTDRCRSLDPRPSWAWKQRGEGSLRMIEFTKRYRVQWPFGDCVDGRQLFSRISLWGFSDFWVIFQASNFKTTGFFRAWNWWTEQMMINDHRWFSSWPGMVKFTLFGVLFSTSSLTGFNCS